MSNQLDSYKSETESYLLTSMLIWQVEVSYGKA